MPVARLACERAQRLSQSDNRKRARRGESLLSESLTALGEALLPALPGIGESG